MTLRTVRIENLLAVALAVVLGGCAAAAVGAAAGAAGAIAYTERGASSQVNTSVGDATAATERAFEEMDIAITGRETKNDTEVTIKGERGDMDVNVAIERKDPSVTEIHVTARESALDYDREYARNVLSRIIEQL